MIRTLSLYSSCSLRKLDIGSLDSSIAMACCSQQRLTNLGAFAGTFMKVHVHVCSYRCTLNIWPEGVKYCTGGTCNSLEGGSRVHMIPFNFNLSNLPRPSPKETLEWPITPSLCVSVLLVSCCIWSEILN